MTAALWPRPRGRRSRAFGRKSASFDRNSGLALVLLRRANASAEPLFSGVAISACCRSAASVEMLCGSPSAESDALDLHAIAVAELKRAGRARRRHCREKFPPDAIHFVVMPDIGEDDIDLHDPVERGPSRF